MCWYIYVYIQVYVSICIYIYGAFDDDAAAIECLLVS